MFEDLIQNTSGFFPPIFISLLDPATQVKRKGEEISSLKNFNDEAFNQPLSLEKQEKLVNQALDLLAEVYVHRLQKHTLYAANPIERLQVLQRHLPLKPRKFHEEMKSIFMELRDRHTNYILPDKYRWSVAFLPFLIEEFYEDEFPVKELRNDNNRYYMISKISTKKSYVDDDLLDELKKKNLLEQKQGILTLKESSIIITHWNGAPIEHAIELNSDFFAGSNEEARHARGLQNMTIRPLFNTLPPDEEEGIIIKYFDLEAKQSDELKFEWKVWESKPAAGSPVNEYLETALGIDGVTELVRRVKRALFAKEADPSRQEVSLMPNVFRYETKDSRWGKFCHLRIFTFDANYIAILYEFIRIIKSLPQEIEGLIIDVRGNSGGFIPAADLLLQLLTPRPIESQRFQFICTPLTLRLCQTTKKKLKESEANSETWEQWEMEIYNAMIQMWEKWEKSIESAIETGDLFSHSIPLAPTKGLEYVRQISPKLWQHYKGRVLLITDALSYSTTDMFAAGFQDNKIGPILGASGLTGGGGANVWLHHRLGTFLAIDNDNGQDQNIRSVNATIPRELPIGPTFTVAVRRSIRVGANEGLPLEDWGVTPEVIHKITRRDLSDSNKDLLDKAAEILLNTVTNQDIINAFLSAAKNLLGPDKAEDLRKKAGMNLDPHQVLFNWNDINKLADLSPTERQAIIAELPYINQDILNAFEWAASELKIPEKDPWAWMENAGVGSVNELAKSNITRATPNDKFDIEKLNLDSGQKEVIRKKLLEAVEKRSRSPRYRNFHLNHAFDQAARKLVDERYLMVKAGVELSDLAYAPQAIYTGPEIDQLPNLDDKEKQAIKRELSNEKRILAVLPTNQDVINAYWLAGNKSWELMNKTGMNLTLLANARQAIYTGPEIDQLPNLDDKEKQAIKKELRI